MLARVIGIGDYLPRLIAVGCFAVALVVFLGLIFTGSRHSYFLRWRFLLIGSVLTGSFLIVFHNWREARIRDGYQSLRTGWDIARIEAAAFSFFMNSGDWPSGTSSEIMAQLSSIDPDSGSYPQLEVLRFSDSGTIIDPWGSEVQFSVSEVDGFKATSFGPDKTAGTRDDIPKKPKT